MSRNFARDIKELKKIRIYKPKDFVERVIRPLPESERIS